MSFRVQEAIHKWELGAGQWVIKVAAAVLVFVALAIWYDLRVFRGLSAADGMDAAQLARNVARGEGYTTRFLRPFSAGLMRQHKAVAADATSATSDAAKTPPKDSDLSDPHPDLANAPFYPVVLAGALKAMPFDYPDSAAAALAGRPPHPVYAPDYWIAGFNQLLFLIAVVLTFRLARNLFDEPVAWVTVVVIVGSELYWHLTAAGHETTLLIVLLLALLTVLVRIERLLTNPLTEPNSGSRTTVLWGVAAGLLTGAASLTRYSLCLLIVPVVAWLAAGPASRPAGAGPGRAPLAAAAAVAFLVVLLPWVIRNYTLSGTPFGTATYAFAANSGFFPGNELERSLVPDFNRIEPGVVWEKFVANGTEILQSQFATFAGSWTTAFFLVGLLVPFRNPLLGRLRWLVVGFVAVLFVAQAVGRTGVNAPMFSRVSAENLLILTGPAAVMFGVGFLFVLLQGLAAPLLRWFAITAVAFLVWAPLLTTLTTGKRSLEPGFIFPPAVQEKATAVGPRDLIMSDVPWAVAWYGDRTSVWLPLRHRGFDAPPATQATNVASPAAEGAPVSPARPGNDFYSIHRLRPVTALYLSGVVLHSVDTAEVAQWREDDRPREGDDWEEFLQRATSLMKVLGGANAAGGGQDTPGPGEVETFRRLLQLADQHWPYGSDRDWPDFLLGIYVNREVPSGFPLKRAPFGLWPELFLTDTERNTAD